ncbi:MAG: DUF4400 domain-containing protein [Pseudomonadota bacterium]|nr:DUF4400 domain-containing protein [Pseudomonadota bacterium]
MGHFRFWLVLSALLFFVQPVFVSQGEASQVIREQNEDLRDAFGPLQSQRVLKAAFRDYSGMRVALKQMHLLDKADFQVSSKDLFQVQANRLMPSLHLPEEGSLAGCFLFLLLVHWRIVIVWMPYAGAFFGAALVQGWVFRKTRKQSVPACRPAVYGRLCHLLIVYAGLFLMGLIAPVVFSPARMECWVALGSIFILFWMVHAPAK